MLIRAFLTLFNSLHVINTCSASFFMDAGNNIPNVVNLYATFFCFLSMLTTLSSSISFWTGLSSPTISKFCWAHYDRSIGSCIGSFLVFPILVRDRLWIFLSLRVGRSPLMFVSWKLKMFLIVSLLTRILRKFSRLIILNISFSVFFVEITYWTTYRYFII